MNYPFSHIGIPTTEEKTWDGYCEPAKFHYTDFSKDEFKIEWVKFDPDSPASKIVQSNPHVSYLVEDIDEALKGRELLGEVFSPAPGVRVAYISHNHGVVEFLEIKEA